MENPIVEVRQGKLRGINEKNINGINYVAFRGVPYAKPPIGNLRFKVTSIKLYISIIHMKIYYF